MNATERSFRSADSSAGDGLIHIGKQALVNLKQKGESLPLRAIRIANSSGGAHLSRFKGRGMEFDEARLYQAGDEIRNIDWRITARTGRPHTKLFREEKERVVTLWVDFRCPMFFATRGRFKSVVASEAAAMIGWSTRALGDRLGAQLFSEQAHHELRPRNGDRTMLRLIGLLSEQTHSKPSVTSSEQRANAMESALARLSRVTRPGSLLVLISDFRDFGGQAESHLTSMARHNDLLLIRIYDPLEADLPRAGHYSVSDGRRLFTLNSGDDRTRDRYRQRDKSEREHLTQLCRRHRMHMLNCATDEDLHRCLFSGLGGETR